jgi:hypothetical protein
MSEEYGLTNLPKVEGTITTEDKDFNSMVGAGFLPRVQPCTFSSAIVQQKGFKPGNIALVYNNDKFDDLGDSVDIMPVKFRWHAMVFLDGKPIEDSYDHLDEVFKRIRTKADSRELNTGCMYGPEFLVWLPEQSLFGTFYLSSYSARKEALPLKKIMDTKKIALLRTVKSTNEKKQTWFGPQIIESATSTETINTPSLDELQDVLTKFINPKVITPQEVADPAANASRAR